MIKSYLWACTLGALALGAAVLPARADYPSEVLGLQPLTYWRFNDNVSVPAYDTATNLGSLGPAGNGLYVSGVVHQVPGALVSDPANAAAQMPNVNDASGGSACVRIPWQSALNGSSAFSAEFWAKPAITSAIACPASSVDFNATTRYGWLFYQGQASLTDGNGWFFRLYHSAGNSFAALSLAMDTNQWYHLVGTYDGASTIKLYVNGALAATSTLTGTYTPNINRSDVPMTFGCRGDGAAGNYGWGGSMDEAAYYSSALGDADVLAHYQAGTNASPATPYATLVQALNPMVYLRLNEPVKVFAVAPNAGSLGSAEDGIYVGATNIAGPSGTSYPGLEANNRAAAFDGTDTTYVQAKSFGVSGPLTILAWVKPSILSADRAIAGENASYAFKLLDTELRFTTPGILDHTSSGAGVQADVWQQVGVTFNPGTVGGVHFYLNGQQVGTPLDASAMTAGTTAFWIGKNQWAGQGFGGDMDEVAVYDKILTAGRIMSLYFTAIGSNAAPFMVSDPPTVSPAGTIYTTTPFTITPDVAGFLPMSYQWRLNGANLPGATTYIYSKSSAATSDIGTYDVVITNAFGAVTSQVATVTIDPAVPPTIDQQPVSRYVYPGGTASFTVAASGTTPITYQWKHAGTNLLGATSLTLILTNCTAAQAGAYTVGVTNVAGGRLSSTANLTLKIPAANTYEQAVVATGPVAFWRFNETAGTTAFDYSGGHDGFVVNNVTLGTPGPASPSYAGLEANNTAYAFDGADAYVQAASLGLPGPISVAAWVKPNSLTGDRAIAGENASWAFKLLGNELRFTTPGILDHDSSGAALTVGEWYHVAVTFAPGTANGAKFYVNGRLITSVTASALTKGSSTFWIGKNQWAGQVFDGVIDEVVVCDKILSADTIASMYATAAYGTTTAPFITTQPTPQAAVAGAPAALTVGAAGSLPLSYQWKKAGSPIPGATTSKLAFASVAYADADSYSVTITNAVGSTNSAAATLTVLPPPTFANLTNDLVLHLRFDGNYSDTSGRANDANAPNGSPTFLAGEVGQAVHIATTPGNNYLVVSDNAGDLMFEETNSFTVSFWVRYTAGFNDNPIIGNAINSTWQLGWVFTDSATVGKLEWSLASTGGTSTYLRDPVGPAVIGDGAWHNVVGVVDRGQQMALAYVDGVLDGSWSIAGLGSLNPGNLITIGQDPNGSYGTETFDLDDVGIWRRALTPYQALSIYNAAQGAGQSFDVYGPVRVNIATAGTDLVLAWQAGILLQSTNVAGPYTAVPGATAPSYRTTATGSSKFFRLQQ